MQVLRFPKHVEDSVLSGHPWIYRNQLPRAFSPTKPCWVELGFEKLQAFALYDPQSALALRVYSREQHPDLGWVTARVEEAMALRALFRSDTRTDAYRLINGEGDRLPGVVVDVYAGHAVISLASKALELLLPWLETALWEALRPGSVSLRKSARKEGASGLLLLRGERPSGPLVVRENGLELVADLEHGQKTGLFLDQRDNRALVERFAGGRRVLNLFSYSAGFSLYALRGGATEVTSVDAAPAALEDARENFRRNGFDPRAHHFVVGDVFEFLEACRLEKRSYDFVICDPPSFGSQKAQHDRARAAYARLFAAALKVTEPAGLFAASSCTARVTPAELAQALADGARRARRQVQLLADTGHAPDHPILAGHPEGRYLKFLLGRVSRRC